MKRTLIWCLPCLVLLVSVTGLRAQQTAGTEKAVTALEQQWLQAEKTSNADLLAPLLADNFVSTSAAGKVTGKSETLANLKMEKWTNADYSDVRVRVYGDTAVATGAFKGKGTDASGKSLDEHVRWTDTWVKMPSGKWQCVASHGSAVKM
jgi:ketosteroid isomerase-like protein